MSFCRLARDLLPPWPTTQTNTSGLSEGCEGLYDLVNTYLGGLTCLFLQETASETAVLATFDRRFCGATLLPLLM